MKSAFHTVALDRIRYSLVWEDSQTLYDALAIRPDDHLLIVTSAGCNVLNALLSHPATVTAVDVNPVQNTLLLLKKHIILHHDFTVYHALLGFAGREAVTGAKQTLFETLPVDEKNYWSGFFDLHPDGLLTSGKLESYITGFYGTLTPELQQMLHQLTRCTNVKEQYEYFISHLHNSSFRQAFINYFDDENLSRGRDLQLLTYADEPGGLAFYNRLAQQVQADLVSTNFYFRFFFFGPLHMPESILPPCYRKENYSELKLQLHTLQVVTGEAVDYLLSAAGSRISKASLSNIFEYTSRQEFAEVCHVLAGSGRRLRIVFWNLLNNQGADKSCRQQNLRVQEIKPSKQHCFYFKNVFLLHDTHNPSPTTFQSA